MATFSKVHLSGSAAGEPILVAATSTPGTTINAQSAGSEIYEIWAWAANQHTAAVLLTIEWGGTAAANKIVVTIPANEGLFSVIPGLSVTGSVTFKAFAGTTNVINIVGFCNKIA